MSRKKKNRRLKPIFKIILGILIFILILGCGYFIYDKYFGNDVNVDGDNQSIYIPAIKK